MQIRIRRFQEKDFEPTRTLLLESNPESESHWTLPGEMKEAIGNSNSHDFVAEIFGGESPKIVGVGASLVEQNSLREREGVLQKVLVHPDFRRKAGSLNTDIHTVLVLARLKAMFHDGALRVFVPINIGSVGKAAQKYARLGFEEGEFPKHLENDYPAEGLSVLVLTREKFYSNLKAGKYPLWLGKPI